MLANIGNDRGFISKEHISIGTKHFREVQSKARELMLKVNNIVPLWRIVIPNIYFEVLFDP